MPGPAAITLGRCVLCIFYMYGTLWYQQIALSLLCNVLDVWPKLKRNNSNAAEGEFWNSIFWSTTEHMPPLGTCYICT